MLWKAKHAQVVEALRDMLAAGEWREAIPGYRVLGQRLQVSRPTIEKALVALEHEGWVSASTHGTRRRILAAPAATHCTKSTPTLLIASKAALDDGAWEVDRIHELIADGARRLGWRVAFARVDFVKFRNPGALLERLVQTHGPDRIVLMDSNAHAAYWCRARNIPCYCIGGSISKIRTEIDGASQRWADVVRIGGEHLHASGHRKILCPQPPEYQGGRAEVIDTALATWGRQLPRRELERLLPVRGPAEADLIHTEWRNWFVETEPTAVMVSNNYELLSLLGFCNKAGIRIPADLSVVSLAWSPLLRWYNPAITSIQEPVEAVSRAALAWLRAPVRKPKGLRTLECTLVPGKTVAAPRRGR